MTDRIARFCLTFSLAALPAFAQAGWDNTGNSMLNGAYYFRQIFYLINPNSATLSDAVAFYGTINFNGSGSYTTSNTQLVDLAAGTVSAPTPSGTYAVAASGQAFMTNPLVSTDNLSILVNQQGIVIGAATENKKFYNDLFIAAPQGALSSSPSAFKGAYSMSYLDVADGLGALSQMSPDGAGHMGTVAVTGYVSGSSTKYTQNLTGANYIVSNGAAVVTFPTNQNAFFSGPTPYYLYFSPDGNFVFGGGRYSADMFVGVRTGTGTPSLSGLYYEAGFDDNPESLYGSLSANNGVIVGHERVLSVFNASAFHLTYSAGYTLSASGTYSDTATNYVVGGGNIRIASGIGPNLSLSVALPAPNLDAGKISPSGVFLNPTGVVNAGSSAPFTAAIAPGELLTLYGSNLSSSTQITGAIPFPTTLNNTQVNINGLPAPLYYVTPTQLSAIVPYAVTSGVAQIQVINNGKTSNIVTMQVSSTAPGILTQSQNGIGYGDAVHQDGRLVNAANPAQPGETVLLFLTGLGAVNPGIPDGAAGPVGTLSQATNTITADVNGTNAPISYAGLAPQLAGLYQINFTIPSGLTVGDNALDIAGPDSYTSECLIAIGNGSSGSAEPLAVEHREAVSKPLASKIHQHHITPLFPARSPQSIF